jgi:hypothetical protein
MSRKINHGEFLRGVRGWDNGERNVLEGLSESDMKDVFRTLYGYSKEDYSFYLKN